MRSIPVMPPPGESEKFIKEPGQMKLLIVPARSPTSPRQMSGHQNRSPDAGWVRQLRMYEKSRRKRLMSPRRISKEKSLGFALSWVAMLQLHSPEAHPQPGTTSA